MRTALIFFLLALPAWAQEKATTDATAPACGPNNIKFDVTQDKSPHPVAQPEPGKALVYFIQDKGAQSFGIGGSVETMIGLDGTWVGANRNNSYFSVSVEPGEHHACSTVPFYLKETVELAHFTAEAAGKVYYFRVRVILTRAGTRYFLAPLDSDQAKYWIASYPLSVSHPKK
ncbi:MAG: hypothetical protein WA603_13505 [Candidatus Acidiferrales bacterium]